VRAVVRGRWRRFDLGRLAPMSDDISCTIRTWADVVRPVAEARIDVQGLRICIAGGPRTGKTTLAGRLFERHDWLHDVPDCDGCGALHHTDDLAHLGWSEASAAAALWFDAPGPWIVEGVAVPRALRKWLAAHPEGKPCDVVHWLEEPHEPLSRGQAAMAKGCATVWTEIVDELIGRGVRVVVGVE
jgi:hypothetical protein